MPDLSTEEAVELTLPICPTCTHPEVTEGATRCPDCDEPIRWIKFVEATALTEAQDKVARLERARRIWICPECDFVAGNQADVRSEQPWCGPCYRGNGERIYLIRAALLEQDDTDARPTGECRVAMSGPTCLDPNCPPCQHPELEERAGA